MEEDEDEEEEEDDLGIKRSFVSDLLLGLYSFALLLFDLITQN